MIERDPLALSAPGVALDVSDLLRSAVVAGTFASYNTGFSSLSSFCSTVGQLAMPVRNVILIAWMHHLTHKPSPVKPSTLKKYISGIRFMHIINGFTWSLSDDPLVVLAKRALAKRFPEANQRLKVPISIGMLLRMCAFVQGWPKPELMSFQDLLWVCASCIMLFAALRGGELTRVRGSSRPLLTGNDVFLVNISEHDGSFSSGVRIRIRAPKTEPGATFQEASAIDASSEFTLNPSFWLTSYRARAQRERIDVLGAQAAFKCQRGQPVTRDFMVDKANALSGGRRSRPGRRRLPSALPGRLMASGIRPFSPRSRHSRVPHQESRPMGLERGSRPLHLCFGRGAPRRLEGDGYVRAYGPTVCDLRRRSL